MEIQECRVVVRARDFDRSCRFYGEVLALPRLGKWDAEVSRGALYQAGGTVVEVLGEARPSGGPRARDERFSYSGPEHKITLTLKVPSAQKAYEELQFRDRNIPGGLRSGPGGRTVFETHDPDGVKILCTE